MKSLVFTFLALTLSLQAYSNSYKTPDILIDSKLEYDWSGFLITKLRTMLKNNGVPDPFTLKLDEPMVITDSIIESYLDQDGKDFIKNLGELIGLDILKGKTKVVINGLAYDIKDFKTNLNATERSDDGISIGADFSASKINLRADNVTLSIMIPSKDPAKSAQIDLKLIRPVIRASGDRLINFFAKVKIQDNKDHFKFLVPEANFDEMAEALMGNPKGIYMNFRDIEIPDIKIRIGNRTLQLENQKVKDLLNNQQKAIKSLLMSQLASQFKKGLGTTILKVMEKYKMPKESWLESSMLVSFFKLEKFSSDLNRNNLEINMPGDFCSPENFKVNAKKCLSHQITQPKPSRLNQKMNDDSVDYMKDMIDNGHANLVASISEDYVNKLLVSTFDAGLWHETMKEAGVALGPNKMMILMEEKGESATLVLDLLYTAKKIERLAIGAKQVRFPLIIKASVRIQNVEGIPNLIIHFNSVDDSDKTLLHGRPEIGVVSNVHTLRFKKKVIAAIKKDTAGLPNKDIMSLPFPQIKDLGLENVDFESDGIGRMNAILRLKEN